MRRNKRQNPNTITVENTVPHLLEAIFGHDDTPEWLKDLVFDGIENRRNGSFSYTALFWASQLEGCPPDEIKYYDREGIPMTYEESLTRDPSTVLQFPRPKEGRQ